MSDGQQFNEDYFLRGKELGISGYTDYRWMPELTIPMVVAMVSHLKVDHDDTILDFGCARGYIVRALREMGYNAWGYDISQWALENADDNVKKRFLICNESTLYSESFDWVIAKDVLEHISKIDVVVHELMEVARKGVFVVVPLANHLTPPHATLGYDVPEYEKDITHIHRRPLHWWVERFCRPGWSVEARYRVRGVKDNYSQYSTGNGFIVARRIG